MTVIRFFSDPHVGKELKANTTPASRAMLAKQIHLHGLAASGRPYQDPADPLGGDDHPVHFTVCAGDLFDQDSNPEHVILQGAEVARRCDRVLGGNHDVKNIAERESSLSALAKLTGEDRFVMPPEPGRTSFSFDLVQESASHLGDVALYMVPHHARQQEFELALEEVYQHALQFDAAKTRVRHLQFDAAKTPVRRLLVVHCNYHLTFEAGENDLNLTDAKARQLLRVFDYIVMGHDHRPRTECEGRLIVLGNTHPTSFSDQGAKYTWFYNSETNSWAKAINAADSLMEVEIGALLAAWRGNQLAQYAEAEWIDIHGTLQPEDTVDMAKAIRDLRKRNEYLYAVRASRVLIAAGGTDSQPEAAQKTLIEIIEEQLAGSDLLELFIEAKNAKE